MGIKEIIKQFLINLLGERMIYFFQVYGLRKEYFKSLKKLKNKTIPLVNFYSDEETIEMIISQKKSISRYGDGEIRWMAGIQLKSFQEYSIGLAEDLRKAFNTTNSNVLIGLPIGLFNRSKCTIFAKMYWTVILANSSDLLCKYIDINKKYINASITRPYIDYTDISYSKKIFELVKRIWQNKDIVIVEGENSKLGIGNDLFIEAKSIKRILCPSKDAYSKKTEIKKYIIDNISKDVLLLGALGPTASILASELTDEGYQFIDIGHIDIEYMWFLSKARIKTTIPGKYVNESDTKIVDANLYDNDPEYQNSILKVIK